MDPQSAAHLIRLLRTIAIELRLANDIATVNTPYPGAGFSLEALEEGREAYRAEMT